MKLLASLTVLAFGLPASALIIDGPNIGVSKMIPREGDEVTWLVPVLNDQEEPFEGELTVGMRYARRGEGLGTAMTVVKELKLEPEASEDFAFAWIAPANGYYRVVFEIDDPDRRVVREIAVTKEDVYFAWFGAPREFRWCNVPTTVKDEEEEWWLRRGAIPAHWKGGVCYKEWSVEQFVESWGGSEWIAIDEIGGPGEVTDKFIEAWRQLKQQKPAQWIAVWYMGAHDYWAEVSDLVDLFLPEIYLNYRGNHLGQFDSYFAVARKAGVMDQVIPGLGINQIKNDKGQVTNSPTRADVLRQFRYVKRTAPELPGIGFFTSGSAAWGVAEYADALCEDYFIKPVLTIQPPEQPMVLSGEPTDETRTATVTARNIGNMDAEGVVIEWRVGWPDNGARLFREPVPRWLVGEEKTFSHRVSRAPGWEPIEFRIVDSDGYTVLDGLATEYVIRPPQGFEEATAVVIPEGAEHPAATARFATVTSDGPFLIAELGRGIRRDLDAPCAVLPARPGTQERLVAFPAAASPDGPRAILVTPAEGSIGEAPNHSRDGSLLTISNDYYEATLDLATDQIAALAPEPGGENLFSSPWVLNVAGHEGIGEASVDELPGCLVVTVPYDSEKASGESQYVFFDYSPTIRIARSWAPKGEVTISGARDRCGLFQKSGAFALQPGVGGPIQRGKLHDGDKYRDLLFGYHGSAPTPENADLAGWIDFCYGADGNGGGFGVAIEYRWEDSGTKSYDVTRLYDASDWLEVLYLWGREKTFARPQRSCIYLVPHGAMDFTDESVVPPAKALWDQLHARQLRRTR